MKEELRQQSASASLDARLMGYIWAHTKRHQLWILLVVILSMPTYFMLLDLPKTIVNGPILGVGFEGPDGVRRLLNLSFSVPHWLSASGRLTIFQGVELPRLEALMVLSAVFLLLVIANGMFKLYINTYKGKLGERMLRRLRYDLIDRLLRFPMAHFKRTKSAELATMIKDEVEPMGEFIGDAYVRPVYMGGQAATAMAFIVLQNLWLGLIAAGVIMLQAVIIPKLRRRLIVLGVQRQLSARELAGRVGEIAEGISAIHVNDTSNFERADISERLGKIYWIRFELYKRKFFVKFLNNFLAQVTPFLFYSFGGYLALKGKVDIGQLVAVIAAYKDLPAPIKELIDWDQQRIDVQAKFTQVVEQFSQDNMLNPDIQAPAMEAVLPITTPITISNLAVADDLGTKLFEQVNLKLAPGERIAIVGPEHSGGDALADAIVRLLTPSGGRISIGETNLLELPESLTGRRLAYASPDEFLPQASLRDTLLYVLKHAPLREASYDAAARRRRQYELTEARHAGNTLLDIHADWVDWSSAGAEGAADLMARIRNVIRIADLEQDILGFGLRGIFDPSREPEVTARVVAARKQFQRQLSGCEFSGLVEVFDRDAYTRQATVAENLLFGTRVGAAFGDQNLSSNAYLHELLGESGLDRRLFEMGRQIASIAIEMFKDLPPEHPFFEQLSFMTAEQLPVYQALLQVIEDKPMEAVSLEDRRQIVCLTFPYVEPAHRLGLLDEATMRRIVEARHAFRTQLPKSMQGAIEFYDPERYNNAETLQDNIIFGRVNQSAAGSTARVVAAIYTLLREQGLEDAVFQAGLDFNIGSGGARLSSAQKAKIRLARSLLKRPDYAVLKRPLAALDMRTQEKITRAVLDHASDPEAPFGIAWVLSSASLATPFDKVVVFEHGTVAEIGSPEELIAKNGSFAKLLG